MGVRPTVYRAPSRKPAISRRSTGLSSHPGQVAAAHGLPACGGAVTSTHWRLWTNKSLGWRSKTSCSATGTESRPQWIQIKTHLLLLSGRVACKARELDQDLRVELAGGSGNRGPCEVPPSSLGPKLREELRESPGQKRVRSNRPQAEAGRLAKTREASPFRALPSQSG